LEQFMNQPIVIKMISKLPDFLQPAPGNFLHILGINAEGEIVYNIQKENPSFAQISSVQESYGQLFFGSLTQNGIGRIALPK
ncbi:MAG: SMP-30/gluconolactonase/LRE family protein, partial [Bacteroidota bacterium]